MYEMTPVKISYPGQRHTLIIPNSGEKLPHFLSYLYPDIKKKLTRFVPQSVLLDLFVFWLLFEFHVGEKGEYKETQWTQRRRFSSWPAYHDTYSFGPLIILKYG